MVGYDFKSTTLPRIKDNDSAGSPGCSPFFLMSIYYDNKGQRFMEKHRPDGKKIIGISTDQ